MAKAFPERTMARDKIFVLSDMWNLMPHSKKIPFKDYASQVADLHRRIYPFYLRGGAENYIIKDSKRDKGEFCVSNKKLKASYDKCMIFAKKHLYPVVKSLTRNSEDIELTRERKKLVMVIKKKQAK